MEGEKSLLTAIKATLTKPSWVVFLFLLFAAAALIGFQIPKQDEIIFPPSPPLGFISGGMGPERRGVFSCSHFFSPVNPPRKVARSIADFGGVGDGATSNTAAFRRAMEFMETFRERGGAQLNVPPGRWLTGSFNLTSNFTLFLQRGALILGSQDPNEWPIIQALPSYGRGRERLGGRHISLIHGNSLSDVVITGENGTIDGQGKMWWDLWWNKTLKNTRGHLVELVNSNNILISNLTFLNSPFWNVHPVYCSNVVIRGMTILAPLNAPNTDGIDPDSSTNVCIEDCYIESGDDLVAVKSGWDHYGMRTARPSTNVIIQRVSGTTPTCSGVGIGSEMSGGVSNVIIKDLYIKDSAAGVRIKTDKGRGGYILNITIHNITMERVKIPLRFSRGANDHPDEGWDPNALPVVKGISVSNVVSLETRRAPLLQGIKESPFEGICIKNISIFGLVTSTRWNCEYISGASYGVFPLPCSQLKRNDSTDLCANMH